MSQKKKEEEDRVVRSVATVSDDYCLLPNRPVTHLPSRVLVVQLIGVSVVGFGFLPM